MEIDINQKKLTIGEKYRIFIDGQQTHSASTKLFRWLPEINLFEHNLDTPKFTLNRKWAWFKISFDLTRFDNRVFEFRTKKFWRRHYYCQVENDLYEIFGHRRRKYSVYKNDKQIAWWDKNAVTWFDGDNYKIIADRDCAPELLISFCLIIDAASSNANDGKMLTIDIGNIGPQAKKFDPTWQPRYCQGSYACVAGSVFANGLQC
jgi:hypothetical protein